MASISDLFNPPPKAYNPYEDLLVSPGKEVFARFFQSEVYFIVPQAHYSDDAKMASRAIAVHIIETNYPMTLHAFDPLIPFMAITYFDRYTYANADFPPVVGTSGKATDIELFAFCCLTISWKLRDSNFSLIMFLREKNTPYAPENFLEVELAISRGLEFRMRTVTPYLFAGFLTPYLDLRKAESEIHNLILATQRDVGFGGKRPSVIAAAALLAVANGMVSTDHGFYLLMSVIREVQPLIPLEDEIVECAGQMGLMYKPPVDDTPLPPRRRRAPPPPPPRGQTSSGSIGAPAGTVGPASGQRAGKQHVADNVESGDDVLDDILDDIIDVHVVDSDEDGDVGADVDEDEIVEDPVYDLVPRMRRVTTDGVGITRSTSQTTANQTRVGEGTGTNQTTDQQTNERPVVEEQGSGDSRKQPTCSCNIQ